MRAVDDILEQAKRLSPRERRRLVAALKEGFDAKTNRRASRRTAFERLLALGGVGHSTDRDVSSDKYRHLGKAYTDAR